MVDFEMHMVNQREDERAYATGTVALPSSYRGLPVYSYVPADLAEKAAQMLARHHELKSSKRKG